MLVARARAVPRWHAAAVVVVRYCTDPWVAHTRYEKENGMLGTRRFVWHAGTLPCLSECALARWMLTAAVI